MRLMGNALALTTLLSAPVLAEMLQGTMRPEWHGPTTQVAACRMPAQKPAPLKLIEPHRHAHGSAPLFNEYSWGVGGEVWFGRGAGLPAEQIGLAHQLVTPPTRWRT